MSDLSNLITGLSQGLSSYLGDSINQKRSMEKAQYQNQLDMQKQTQASELALENQKAIKTWELAQAGKISPETAAELFPEFVDPVNKFISQNGRPPTTDEFKTMISTIPEKKESGTEPTIKPVTPAQKGVDREFAKEYTKYVAGGGYADVINQIQTLEGVIGDLEGGKKNLTGPVVGTGDISGITGLPRKMFAGKGVAAQQAVEQSIQRSLKQTLGGQFTEREGTLFMQRGYDPQLSEKENAKKLRRAVGQLKSMALSKQKAVDYYEEHGTLTGFKGEFFTLKDGEIVKAKKEDFYKMIGEGKEKGSGNTDSLGLGI